MAHALSPAQISAFSLVELIIFCGLLAIFSVVGVGAWFAQRTHLRLQSVAHEVRQALLFARMEAIQLQRPVVYCGSQDLIHCDGHWSLGQLVQIQHGKRLRRYQPAANIQVTYTGNLNHKQQILFTSEGITGGQQGHFSICSAHLTECIRLVLHYSGEVVAKL